MEVLLPVLALAGLAVGSDLIAQIFFGGPFIQIVDRLLESLGLLGVPRDLKTERAGILLSESNNARVSQLGRAIYWAARAHGRVLSSASDQRNFFVPAVRATINALKLPPAQQAWLIKGINEDCAPCIGYLDDWLLEQSGPPGVPRHCPAGYHPVGDRCEPDPQRKPSATRIIQRIEQFLRSEASRFACQSGFLTFFRRALDFAFYAEAIFTETPVPILEKLITDAQIKALESLAKRLCAPAGAPVGGGPKMPAACHDTHRTSTEVTGPGACCKSMPASVRSHPAEGDRWATTNKKGQCIVCELAASTAKNAIPGQLKIKRGKAGQLCPTKQHGCCALLA